jgi:hypothetical protein
MCDQARQHDARVRQGPRHRPSPRHDSWVEPGHAGWQAMTRLSNNRSVGVASRVPAERLTRQLEAHTDGLGAAHERLTAEEPPSPNEIEASQIGTAAIQTNAWQRFQRSPHRLRHRGRATGGHHPGRAAPAQPWHGRRDQALPRVIWTAGAVAGSGRPAGGKAALAAGWPNCHNLGQNGRTLSRPGNRGREAGQVVFRRY